ncbi:hypothetical protein JCM10207_002254 [Rhodosporidiobolus poonsookiae]
MASLSLYIQPSSGYTSLTGTSALSLLLADCLTPEQLDRARGVRDGLHVTLLTKIEARLLRQCGVANPFQDTVFTISDIVPLGLGGDSQRGVSFAVVLLNIAAVLRRKAGLPPKAFHISLETPPHASPEDFPHGLSTLRTPLDVKSLTSSTVLDALAHHYLLSADFSSSLSVAARFCALSPTCSKPWVRLGDAALALQHHKLMMLAFGRAWELAEADEPVRAYAARQLGRCGRETEWGTTYFEYEAPQLEEVLDEGVRNRLVEPWGSELKQVVFDLAEKAEPPVLAVEGRERAVLVHDGQENRLMRNFRWILPFHLAVSSIPRSFSDIALLASPALGIRHITTLCAESPLPASFFTLNPHVRNTLLPIADYRAPTVEQIQLFLRLIVESDGPVLVHCGAGKGRAGTMVAAWLVAYGFSRPPERWAYPAYAPAQALQLLRAIRPESVETGEQEAVLKTFYSRIVTEGAPFPDPPSVTLTPTSLHPIVEGTLASADLVVLVGLPGSGKTWFRRALCLRDPSWQSVSSDENRKTSAVLCAASSFRGNGTKLLLDRCNASPSARRELLALAQRATHPVAVFFDTPPALCAYRANLRAAHPSLPPGPRVAAAISHFARELVPPSLGEGFAAVVRVQSDDAAAELVDKLGGEVGLLKFPRTPHLLDLGATTADDLVLPLPAGPIFPTGQSGTTVTITEKVDGANLAFSLSSSRRLLVQNRSHYLAVESGGTQNAEHAQFRKLGAWMEQHEHELQQLLGADEAFPERWILYGEWMAAKHSIHYTALPSLFLAFDLYDRLSSSFLPRALLQARLHHLAPSLRLTPVLFSGPAERAPARNELVRMVQGRSAYIDETTSEVDARREGVAKVVRGDFCAGNEHWSKGPVQLNIVV